MGNEIGASDPVFMKKYGEELKKDSGKWIDSSVWHGKAHTWEKIDWLVKQVRASTDLRVCLLIDASAVEAHLGWAAIRDQGHPECGGCGACV